MTNGLRMETTCMRCGCDFELFVSEEQLASTARMLTEEQGLSLEEAGRATAAKLSEGVLAGKLLCRGCGAGAMN